MYAKDIKQLLKDKRLYQWEVAKALGVTEFTLTRWLRDDLTEEKYKIIMEAVERLQSQRKNVLETNNDK